MRGVLVSLAAVFVLAALAPTPRAHAAPLPAIGHAIGHTPGVYALQVPDKKIQVDIDKNGISAHTVKWYQNPMWIAIGVLAAIVVVLLVIMAARGSGRTIARD